MLMTTRITCVPFSIVRCEHANVTYRSKFNTLTQKKRSNARPSGLPLTRYTLIKFRQREKIWKIRNVIFQVGTNKGKAILVRIDERRRKLIGACNGCAHDIRRLRFENVVNWVAGYWLHCQCSRSTHNPVSTTHSTHQSMIPSEKNWHDIYKMLSRVFHVP